MLTALQPLGAAYVDSLGEGFRGRWCDRYENKNKRSGAFSSGSYGAPPYILMNYKEDVFADVYTLAHEAGHSMHTFLAQKSQLFQDYDYPIFLAEVASTFNEELLTHHLLEKTTDPKMRAYIINRQIDDIRGTLFRQTMFAEFEKIIHAIEESGDGLTLDVFKKEYRALLDSYFAKNFVIDAELELECLRIPHFYSAFYVYKYATGISAAIALSEKVLSGEAGSVDGLPRISEIGRVEISARNIESRRCRHDNAGASRKARSVFLNGASMSWKRSVRLNNYARIQSGPLFAQRQSVLFEQRIRAACGYAELGMTRQSLAELKAIEPSLQNRPEVLHLRLHHLMQRKSWRSAYQISRKLCRVAPRMQHRFPSRRILFAPARQDGRGAQTFAHRARHSSRRTDLLLQHGLLRSAARQSRQSAPSSQNQFRHGRLLSRAREERSGPRIDSASDLSASRSGGLQVTEFKIGRFGKRASVITLRDMTRTSDGLIKRIAPLFEENFAQFGELGAAISIWQNGKPLVDLHGGFRDANRQKPWTADTLVLIWSATKGLGSACLLHVLQENAIAIEQRVAEFWPEFAQGGKGEITLAQLLSHQAGLVALDEKVDVTDYDAVIRALEKQEPLWPPGTAHGYHARTFGFLVDELVRRIAGKRVQANIGEKLSPSRFISISGSVCLTSKTNAWRRSTRQRPAATRSRRSFIAISPHRERWSGKYSLRPADCTPSAK